MPPMLDNLIHEKRVPPIVAVLVAPGPGGQRTIEYDTVSDRYTNFIVPEAAAAIRKTRRLIEPDICVTPKIRAAEPRPIIITLRCEFNAADPADP